MNGFKKKIKNKNLTTTTLKTSGTDGQMRR